MGYVGLKFATDHCVVAQLVFVLLLASTSLHAEERNLPFLKSEITFVESMVSASPGETVQICLNRDAQPSLFALESTTIVSNREKNTSLSFADEIKVTFLPGANQACFDLFLPNDAEASYELGILETEEKVKLHVKNMEAKEGICGTIPQISSVALEDAVTIDAFGNYYSTSMVKIPTNLGIDGVENKPVKFSENCGCDQLGFNLTIFEPYFEDCIYETEAGFDEPAMGPARRSGLCAALQYLENLIVPNDNPCSTGEKRLVNIQIMPSIAPDNYPRPIAPFPSNNLGFASPFYPASSHYIGVRHALPWEIINSGEYTGNINENFYHATSRFNFTDFEWHLDYTNNNVDDDKHDLYSVALHEFSHVIGYASSFSSLFGAFGIGISGSREGLGIYNNFDQNLQISYDNSLTYLDLIENGPSMNDYPFSNQWFFNDEVDGSGLVSGDLHSSCPGPGPNITFKGEVANYPIFTGASFTPGSSFSHLDGACNPPPGMDLIEFVMNPSLLPGNSRRLFQWQELDILRTMGYNIDCAPGDFLDADLTDGLTFDCTQADLSCSIASVNDLNGDLELCGQANTILSIPFCPGEDSVTINRENLEDLILANDPNASEIAFISPLFSEGAASWQTGAINFTLTTQLWGSFPFSYAPIGCNGNVANVSIFSITLFPGQDCGVPSCEISNCEDFDIPSDWECFEPFNSCEENPCNLICNGGFCGTGASPASTLLIEGNFSWIQSLNLSSFHSVEDEGLISPSGWIKGSQSPDYLIRGDVDDLPALSMSITESAYTYLNASTQVENDYLFSADFTYIKSFFGPPDTPPITNLIIGARLIQGESYTPCDESNDFCYDDNAPSQIIFHPRDGEYSEGASQVRFGNCFTSQDNFNALLIEGMIWPGITFLNYEAIDNIELIPDEFSAGIDLVSEICNQPQTLGGEAFCMLSDVHVQYDWYEVGNSEVLLSYDVLNGVVNGDVSFQVAPQQTTTYRLERTILDQADLDKGFEFCTTTDEVTITVIEQLPIPDFTAQLVDGECGVYNYFSDPSTVGNVHRWYLNEQIENAIFSMEVSPTNHMLPDGVHTIIHVVEGRCGTEMFEVPLPAVDCDNSLFTCACEGEDAINIDAGSGTLLSQLIASGEMPANGISEKCLAINGHLLIDQVAMGTGNSYQFNSSEVRMQPGSSIKVEAGAYLSVFDNKDGGIHGCKELWKGISLAPKTPSIDGGRLKLYAARIEDAVHAITLGHGSTFEMIYTTLNRNHIGIYMPPSPSFQGVAQPTSPQYSIISSTSALLDPYDGQEVQTNSISYAGVELNDCKRFQIGGGNNGIEIKQANYGIIARHSGVFVYGSRIHHMVTDPDEGPRVSNTGIRSLSHSWVTLQNSRLHDLRHGVYSASSSLDVQNNIIGEAPSGIRNNVEQGITARMSVGHFARISNQNKMYVKLSGVRAYNSHSASSFLIQDNTIETYSPQAGILGSGISLSDALLSGNDEVQRIISGNIININSTGYGITLRNVNTTTIADNEVKFLPSSNGAGTYRGIRLLQSSGNYVYGNTISSTEAPQSVVFGIYVSEGDQNSLCCNIIRDTYYGVRFNGYCEQTKLRHTTFEDINFGLRCDENTRIGQQVAAGNMWNGTFSLKAAHYSQEENDVNQSRFFVTGSQGSATRPANEDIFVAAGDVDWFRPTPDATLSCEDDDNCDRPELNRLAKDNDFLQKILQAGFYYGSYPETSDWEAKRVFYRSQKATKLENQSDWSTESIAFFNQQVQENSALHKLTTIAQRLEESLATDPLVTEATSQIGLLSDQIFSLDQTIEEGEEPSQDYLTARAVLLEQKAEAFADFSILLQQKESDYKALLAELKQDNSGVSTLIEAAMAMKEVNNWYFETMATGLDDLPPSTESALREMAERCPQRFGSAVSRAQSVLVHYDKSFTPSDECKESDKSGFKASSDSATKKTASLNEILTVADVRIYPNPASGVFTIQLPQNEMSARWNIDLLDVRGKVLESKTMLGKRVLLNADKYSAGVYWIRIQSSDSIISKRVIIQ
jgi:nitrous oxidase accessory protein NosD